MKKEQKEPVKHMTEISEDDVKSIARDILFVKASQNQFWFFITLMIISGILIICGALTGHILIALPGVVLIIILFLNMAWRERLPAKLFLQHWIETGEFYPDDWRYDVKEKKFKPAPAKKEAVSGKDSK